MSSLSPPILQFLPFSSQIDPTFWHVLSKKKIEIYKLDVTPINIVGTYSFGHGSGAGFCVSKEAFDGNMTGVNGNGNGGNAVQGVLINTNTVEEFRGYDKMNVFRGVAEQIWTDITTGKTEQTPSLLNRFLLLTFADLKKYKFYYWFGFPALCFDDVTVLRKVWRLGEVFQEYEIESLKRSYDNFRQRSPHQTSHFLICKTATESSLYISPLSSYSTLVKTHAPCDIVFAFADPSPLPTHPGWPLRNLLVMVRKRWGLRSIRVMCFREVSGCVGKSIVLDVDIGEVGECPKFVGWEKNTVGKLGPRSVDLAPVMDPKRLAETAVDLNLKLMRWRIVPSLDLEKVAQQKCLLLGAGTLGCFVARSLMAWGVRHITFVDNGRVSFSNPVRQPLYTFEDCQEGGKLKALIAAENLKSVFPGVNAVGHDLSIPLPGHHISSVAQTRTDIERLRELIGKHDVVFLLTDNRESRWLPTVLGAAMGKVVVCCALGFDTFLVMRHGIRKWTTGTDEGNEKKVQLGCYFCNDVVAPANSLADRTLDQQCTVTRPGLSAIASATSVELLVAMLNHAKGAYAEADTTSSPSDPTLSPLGVVPHQIRGFLSHFTNLLVVGQAYDKCSACSEAVLNKYASEGDEFLVRALESPGYLEEVSGLKAMHELSEDADVEWNDSDGDIDSGERDEEEKI